MEYGKIISRAAGITWHNKFLILLGILAALGSGYFNGGGGGGGGGGSSNGTGVTQPLDDELIGLLIGVSAAVICVAIFVGIVLWVISTIARGGLIASVDSIESGQKSSFRQGWGAGWRKVWTLLGISFIPAIPALILFVIGLLALGTYGGLYGLFGEDLDPAASFAGLGAVFAVIACLLVPIMLLLAIVRNFAERACMLEDLGVVDAYRRGGSVLMANLGQAIILALLQIGIFIVLGILLFLPGIVLILCCFLWPILLLLQGFTEAFVSALWTLAWRQWTNRPSMAAEMTKAAV
jgi:hypothetical protein